MPPILEDPPVLIAQVGPLEGQQFTVKDTIMIGRDPNIDIVILTPDKQVSRLHASIKTRTAHISTENASISQLS